MHPNTVKVVLTDDQGVEHSLTGCSVGGGEVRIVDIGGFATSISGEYAAIVTKHQDKVGVIKNVVSAISDAGINIVSINLSRSQKGKLATAIIEVDSPVDEEIIQRIRAIDKMVDVLAIKSF